MVIETRSDDEYTSSSGPYEPVFTSSGGMFTGSQHFTVVGGTFNNSTKNYVMTQAIPPDFRMIPMGDIDLQNELTVNKKSGVVERRCERNCARRVYSATINGRNSNVTVAVYQGDGAEEDWGRDAEMYMSARHPNIIQIYGAASYGNIHATVFHGHLVPLTQFLAPHPPIMKVYLYGCYSVEWSRVRNYLQPLQQRNLYPLECTMWIRTSTGRLSVDPVPPDAGSALALHPPGYLFPSFVTAVETSLRRAANRLGPPNSEVLAIKSLAPEQYYRICSVYLSQHRDGSIFTSATVNIGAVISWPSGHRYDENAEIALLPGVDVKYSSWRRGRAENGWSCCRADDVLDTEISLEVYSYYPEGWLSQANLVFSRLQITSDLEDYVFISHISFTLAIRRAGGDPPPGYLFLCPREDFRTGPSSFSWPKRPAYWSLDPEGIEALSTEEAARLGFPSFQLATDVQGSSWDASVYSGLRKFHQAKGFDPNSQEVALHLCHALYQPSGHVNAPLAYVTALEESPMSFSRGFRVTMMVQLMLIFSLSFFSLYEQLF